MENKILRIQELMMDILYYNRMYRSGNPKISDTEFDILVRELEELDPNNQMLVDKDYTPIKGAEQVDLPIDVASLTKLSRDKYGSAYYHFVMWITKHNLQNQVFVCSPKYDGVMLLVDETESGYKPAYKKGEGNKGYDVSHHYKKISNNAVAMDQYSVGELVYSRKIFDHKYSKQYENGRNMVSGKTNPLSDASDELYYADFMRFSLIPRVTGEYTFDKSTQFLLLNRDLNNVEVPYEVLTYKEMTEEKFDELFKKWSVDYEIDGIVIDVNDAVVRENMGRESGSNNPAYARAYKGDFEDRADTTCRKLSWEITKLGNLAPRCWFDPIRLNGATVQKCYVDNAKFVIDSGLYIGADIEVKRSGMIIPRLSKVLTEFEPHDGIDISLASVDFDTKLKIFQEHGIVPSMCPICSGKVEFTENEKGEKVNLMCVDPNCDGKKFRRIVFFFKTMKAKGVGDSTLEMLYDLGYDTVAKILDIPTSYLIELEGYGKSKAEIVYNAIHDSLKNTSITKLMHASGYFPHMGSDKLGIIHEYKLDIKLDSLSSDLGVDQLQIINGIAKKSAETYVNNLPLFIDFYNTIEKHITLETDKKECMKSGGKCEGWVVVFTRWRDKALENTIKAEGGIVKTGYSKAITHVFPAVKGFYTNKEKKAEEDGKIIWDRQELEEYLKDEINKEDVDDSTEDKEFNMDW